MRGVKRTSEERNELFNELERYLCMGFSLKRACSLADLPYSSVRDIVSLHEPLRARTRALQNTVNVQARANIISTIEQGDIPNSKWWLNRFDYTEPQASVTYGGDKEALMTLMEAKQEFADEDSTPENLKELREMLFGE